MPQKQVTVNILDALVRFSTLEIINKIPNLVMTGKITSAVSIATE